MNIISKGIDILLHLDKYINDIISLFGSATYIILFLVISAETGFVFTPFLPGDSLLFTLGVFASQKYLNIFLLLITLSIAAILGDSVNYFVGNYIGEKILYNSHIIKKEYLDRTKNFYERHGKKTIIFARFVPIVRTFAPFIAGIGKMHYPTFLFYNILGGIMWVALFILGGYFFGNMPFVKENMGLVVLGIIMLSFIPMVIDLIRK